MPMELGSLPHSRVQQHRRQAGRNGLRTILSMILCLVAVLASSGPTVFPAFYSGVANARSPILPRAAVSTFGATNVNPQNALQWLQGVSSIIPDDFSFDGFERTQPKLAFVSSRTAHEALMTGTWSGLEAIVSEALQNERCLIEWDVEEQSQSCLEESLFTLLGKKLLERLPFLARISVEIPFISLATSSSAVHSGQRIMDMFRDLGVASDRVLLRLPATYEGLRAAEALEAAGIHVHLTHVYSVEQAALAKEAKVSALQVYVGRVCRAGGDGIRLARDIHNLLSDQNEVDSTALIVASIQNEADVTALSGADFILVPPFLLEQLEQKPLEFSIEPSLTQETPPHVNRFRSFLASNEEFVATLPLQAQELLDAGVQKYKKEHEMIESVIASSQEYV